MGLPDRIDGKLPRYSSLGCYPIVYLSDMDCPLCAACATAVVDDSQAFGNDERVIDCGINWEDPELYCEECNERIESAYAETES